MEQNTNLINEQLDSYIEDAFTYSEGELGLEVDSLEVKCISSKYDNFSLDEDGNLAVNSISFTGSQSGNEICDLVYPVGSIYMSFNNVSPSNLFGGTWERLSGGFIYGCQSESGSGNGSGTNTGANNGNTGSTTLTVDQIPSHSHNAIKVSGYTLSGWGTVSTTGTQNTMNWTAGAVKTTGNNNAYTSNSGGGNGHTHTLNNHSHAIPYIAVFIWKRTA